MKNLKVRKAAQDAQHALVREQVEAHNAQNHADYLAGQEELDPSEKNRQIAYNKSMIKQQAVVRKQRVVARREAQSG